MSKAFTNSVEGTEYVQMLDSLFQIKNCTIVDTRELTDNTFSIVTKKVEKEYKNKERKRIDTNRPDIQKDVMDVIDKFPENNSFYLEKVHILNLDNKRTLQEVTDYIRMDMPRGITLWELTKYCNSISEVQYKDNLFGDKVTISIMKIKPTYEPTNDILFEKYDINKPAEHFDSFSLALKFSHDILNSGKYDNEQINELKLSAYKTLTGYKVELTTNRGIHRSYFVLVDTNCEYLIIAQSIEKTEEEMLNILANVGKSKGLNDYDEFYNSFYVLPDTLEDEDIFLGYSINKLGWSYAKARGYADWSKAMVGHWTVDGYFYNTKKGFWSLGLFDLLTPNTQNHIYGNLYSDDVSPNKTKTDVYGVKGFFVEEDSWWYYSLELNFGIDRYVFAINSENIDRNDMLKRAEKMQFAKGGYKNK